MLDTVTEMAHKHFQGARGSHNWDHTLRVCRLCERLGSTTGVDLDVLLVAAYLHDIGRSCQDDSNGAVCHAEKGARMAAPIVDKLALSEDQKKNILHCINQPRRQPHLRSGIWPRLVETWHNAPVAGISVPNIMNVTGKDHLPVLPRLAKMNIMQSLEIQIVRVYTPHLWPQP